MRRKADEGYGSDDLAGAESGEGDGLLVHMVNEDDADCDGARRRYRCGVEDGSEKVLLDSFLLFPFLFLLFFIYVWGNGD